jgi:hypothetical protein
LRAFNSSTKPWASGPGIVRAPQRPGTNSETPRRAQSPTAVASLSGLIQTTDPGIPCVTMDLVCVMSTSAGLPPRWKLPRSTVEIPLVNRVDGFITCPVSLAASGQKAQLINQFESLPSFCLWTISSSDFTPVSRCYFIFPSRYLFAIGLSPIFSFRRSVPPNLRCTPKQRDSMNPDRTADLEYNKQ